jgi:hypothetical protein
MYAFLNRAKFFLLRCALHALGLDVVTSHRICKQAQQVQSTARLRDKERAEIHMLAQGLGLVQRESRERYEQTIATFFPGKKSSEALTDEEHRIFLQMLRAWTRARAVMKDRAQSAA